MNSKKANLSRDDVGFVEAIVIAGFPIRSNPAHGFSIEVAHPV
jgi:hypothetical protein